MTVIQWWFCLSDFNLACVQRSDPVGPLGDTPGHISTKSEGPSWPGLDTVQWTREVRHALPLKGETSDTGGVMKQRISTAPRMQISTHELLSDAQASLCNLYLPPSVPERH